MGTVKVKAHLVMLPCSSRIMREKVLSLFTPMALERRQLPGRRTALACTWLCLELLFRWVPKAGGCIGGRGPICCQPASVMCIPPIPVCSSQRVYSAGCIPTALGSGCSSGSYIAPLASYPRPYAAAYYEAPTAASGGSYSSYRTTYTNPTSGCGRGCSGGISGGFSYPPAAEILTVPAISYPAPQPSPSYPAPCPQALSTSYNEGEVGCGGAPPVHVATPYQPQPPLPSLPSPLLPPLVEVPPFRPPLPPLPPPPPPPSIQLPAEVSALPFPPSPPGEPPSDTASFEASAHERDLAPTADNGFLPINVPINTVRGRSPPGPPLPEPPPLLQMIQMASPPAGPFPPSSPMLSLVPEPPSSMISLVSPPAEPFPPSLPTPRAPSFSKSSTKYELDGSPSQSSPQPSSPSSPSSASAINGYGEQELIEAGSPPSAPPTAQSPFAGDGASSTSSSSTPASNTEETHPPGIPASTPQPPSNAVPDYLEEVHPQTEEGSALNCEDDELRRIVEKALQSSPDNLDAARQIESNAAARFGGRFNSIVSNSEFAYVNWYGKRNCQLRVNNRHSLTWED